MIFGNSPDKPGLWSFLICFIISLLLLALSPDFTRLYGLLAVFWGFFCLMRALWLMDTAFMFTNKTPPVPRRSHILPWLIVNGKDLRGRLDAGFAAMHTTDRVFILCLFLAAGLAGWALYLRLFPVFPEDFSTFLSQIGTFLGQDRIGGAGLYPVRGCADFLLHFSRLLLIGLIVWLCRGYACAAAEPTPLLVMLASCFFLTLGIYAAKSGFSFNRPPVWAGAGWGSFSVLQKAGFFPEGSFSTFSVRAAELGVRGMALFYMPCFAVLLAVLGNIRRSGRRKYYALSAAAILFLMALADVALASGARSFSVWLSGWSLFAALWGCSDRRGRRTEYNAIRKG